MKKAKVIPFPNRDRDPDDHRGRHYKLITKMQEWLEAADREHMTFREYCVGMACAERLIKGDEARYADHEPERGATARKYESAFTSTDASRRRGYDARRDFEPDDWFESAEHETDADPN